MLDIIINTDYIKFKIKQNTQIAPNSLTYFVQIPHTSISQSHMYSHLLLELANNWAVLQDADIPARRQSATRGLQEPWVGLRQTAVL